ncbi:hypothetical protein PV409_36665 [Streptomyces sp. ME02-6979.5a]|uniref:hypothetical protein n=1 Tax=Streptomyces sp. ME02-6979.5a TaxID=462925 RepID=UPI0029BA3237|nr:hypothetical protein [Streptomyces sp. ME02-6979.5a]MDX3343496.1 hypothetical protein [Streptomyces sp. ME02-6979.5a]
MPISDPPPIQMSYNAPATLSWRVNGGDTYLALPLSIDLCNTLEDQDVAAIGEAVEARLKTLYPEDKIDRVLTWEPSGPNAEVLTVVQEPPGQQGD